LRLPLLAGVEFVKSFASASMIVFAVLAEAAFAQSFMSTGKDGSVIYTNKPPEAQTGTQTPVAMPPGADVTTYQLGGASLEEVQKDAAQKGPMDPVSSHRVWSATSWSAAWNYWTRQEADACRIDVVSVRMKIATKLPEWREPKEVAAVDHCRWTAFVKTLRRKEDVRVAHALARGRELERAILALPARPRCEGFAAEITAMGQALVDAGKPQVQAPPPARPVLMLAKPMAKMPARPAPPVPPKPLPIPKAIFDACTG
jgi:predicted secreted Zn-dependent protease